MRDKKVKEKKNITDDPVKNFEKWKKKYAKTKTKVKRSQKTKVKKRDWEVERENIKKLVDKYSEINPKEAVKFSDFPLSKKTLKGLLEAQYRQPTEIQRQTIGFALQGRDVLGAAKTGSGKTLAFLIPVLECLYREQWTAMDGLGALIISPTRELAYQTFEVLRKVGKNHEFSAGLVIGGKDLKDESEKIHRTNIIICTPGRLLQHMDETATFHASDLHMLVLDEADRILDMGFADTLNAIVENLPKSRQTLLFSATQTRSVKDLARLSLKDPEYVWVHEQAKFSTPATLEQNYVVCELHQKVNMLYSFLRSHLQKKIIVFFACCKEVQYLFRIFCRLRPGISVLALHGKQQQMKRVEVYNDFVRKTSAVLFATDIAARGLDFPAVNWVLQFDCPEDANTYIHRVGRTARYKEGGEALLVLLPSEEKGMISQLQEKKVPINKIQVNPEKLMSVQQKLEAFLAQEKEQKERAQRCFVSYLRSVYLMKNKDVFDVLQLKLPEYAMSLGLAVAPRVRFLLKAQQQRRTAAQDDSSTAGHQSEDELQSFTAQLQQQKTKSEPSQSEEEEDDDDDDDEGDDDEDIKDQDSLKPLSLLCGFNEEDDDDDQKEADLLTVKCKDVFNVKEEIKDEEDADADAKNRKQKESKFKDAKKIQKRNLKVNTKKVFTEDGKVVQQWPPLQRTVVPDEEDDDDDVMTGINVEAAKERLRREDQAFDKMEYRRKIKEKHREKRLKEKAARREASKQHKEEKRKADGDDDDNDDDEDEEEVVAYLSGADEEFDPSTLPDPDKVHNSESSEEDGESSDAGGKKRSFSSEDEDDDDDDDDDEDEDEEDEYYKSKKTPKTSKTLHTCSQCGKNYKHISSLRIHLLSHTGEKPFHCDQCEKTYSTLSGLKIHQVVHFSERPYSCSVCGRSFSRLDSCKQHQKTHDKVRDHVCTECGKSFTTFSQLKQHQIIHSGLKPFKCSYCDRSFTQAGNRKSHERIHTGEKPHRCTECGRSYKDLTGLKNHMRVHSGEKQYVCEHCGKGFNSVSNMRYHLRVHTNEKPHVCSICGRGFSLLVSCTLHEKIHTGEKDKVCDDCGKSFVTNGQLKRHRVVHSGKRPYQCSYCEKSFSVSAHLKIHMRLHTGEMPYRCADCGESFRHSNSLAIHRKKHDQPEQSPPVHTVS